MRASPRRRRARPRVQHRRAGRRFAEATTGADGVALIEHPGIAEHVDRRHCRRLVWHLVTTLQPNEIKPITVHLEPTGTIIGTVLRPTVDTRAGHQVSCEAAATRDDGRGWHLSLTTSGCGRGR
jgi:hypothetical protein